MSYAMNVYMRASTNLNTLERYLGEETMLRVMRAFQMRFRFRHPRTRDFIDTVNEVSGQDLTWFFNELFFASHNFDYGISHLSSYEKKSLNLGIFEVDGKRQEIKPEDVERQEKQDKEKGEKAYITEVTLRRFGEARLGGQARVKLRVVFEDGNEEVREWDGLDRWESFRFETPARAKFAQLDPDLVWLIDSDLANNSLKLKPGRGGVTRLTARFLFWVQNHLHLLSALI